MDQSQGTGSETPIHPKAAWHCLSASRPLQYTASTCAPCHRRRRKCQRTAQCDASCELHLVFTRKGERKDDCRRERGECKVPRVREGESVQAAPTAGPLRTDERTRGPVDRGPRHRQSSDWYLAGLVRPRRSSRRHRKESRGRRPAARGREAEAPIERRRTPSPRMLDARSGSRG